MRKVGKSTENIGKNLMAHVTAPLAGIGLMSLRASNKFTDAIAKVSTIADTTKVPIELLRKDIIKLSNDTGIASAEIADNVYDAISAGQKTGDAVNFVRKSTTLAKAGFAEAGQSLDVLTTIMNAYKMKSEDVTKVSDMLITTQNEGKVTVGELSSVMGKVIPTAVATNTGLNQITAGYALMTKNGIKAAETTTYMNSMLNELSKTGSVADKALRKMSGKSFGQLMKEGKNVSDVLNILDNYAIKNKLSLKDMFGSAEAGKAALVLATGAGKDFNDMLKKMDNSANATKNAYDKLQTPIEKFRKILNKAHNSLLGVGGALTPAMEALGNIIETITDKISKLTPEQQKMIVKFGLIAASVGPVIFVIGKITTGISKTITGINKLSSSIKKAGGLLKYFTSPGHLVVIILAAIAVTALLVYKNWDKLSKIFKKVGKELSKFTGIGKKEIKKIEEIFKRLSKNIGKHFAKAFNNMKKLLPKLKGLFKSISDLFNLLKPIIMPIIKLLAVVFVAKIAFAFTKISIIISAVINTISGIIEGLIGIFKGIIDFVVGVFTGDWNKAWDGVERIFSGVVGIFKSIWHGVIDFFSAPVQAVIDILDSIFHDKVAKVKNAWDGIKEWMKHPIQGTISLIKNGDLSGIKGKNALGTPYWGGGLSVVGEHGPEIVEMPSGSKVHDNKDSRRMVGNGGSVTITFGDVHVRNESDIDAIANKIVQKLKIQSLNMA
ncbi:phage tail tape measure protein [Clostridium tetani]|uniref:Phage tail tape measure protein n=2 Tax=Clostridium tetani TaxID=1513 RepID=A0ABY0EQ64_CLOTA|nr:phage tail tape measure protein [Clostridium tetani]RXI74595.1 phage tail tape measure protein [Clostridium tetani]